MGRLGRDPAMFDYVTEPVSRRILDRAEHALSTLSPADNPYLQWILLEQHPRALPLALRPEHFNTIRSRLDRLELRQASVEQVLNEHFDKPIMRFNLSDIFEYMSQANTDSVLSHIVEKSSRGGRVAYWNMLVPRSRPGGFADRLLPMTELAARLHQQDKAFFYSRFVVEQIA
jgi:S-adenosylmethionine-diacylglycerol 3-amino-3-carboxypropyl transferase